MVLLLLLLLLLRELFRREQNFDDAVKVLKPKTLPAMMKKKKKEKRESVAEKAFALTIYFLCVSEEKRAVTLNTNYKKIRLAYYPNVSDSTPLATSRFQTCF